ncbi:MAG: ATP-binding protein [Candidatus Sumerlaeota bacterium]|nr:ATP-binding protein [Candidatus Sumerlaeota bacterium]
MLTRLRIRNFKRFEEADIELGKTVIFIGPNNCGKSTALQALALCEKGVQRWNEKRKGKDVPDKRPGAAINRRDLLSVPVPNAKLLWHDLHVRDIQRNQNADAKPEQKTRNICIEIIVDGVSNDKAWTCGLEFDYANEESFYCRPLRINQKTKAERMLIPSESAFIHIAYLPPMSGLAAKEPKWEPGSINVLIGEGQTAQVLRNLCYQIYSSENPENWNSLTRQIVMLFGIKLQPPVFISERGEIEMAYQEPNGILLDLLSSGRGLQQTLLLLAHLYANPGAILLLDEPDAHLEILRQRQIYSVLCETAERQGSQIIAASHSEVLLNEAAERDTVIAFVGKPHRIDDRGSQVLKALRDIGFDQYYQAQQTGWALYLENSTDLAILKTFAKILDHEAQAFLERPFVHYVATNLPKRAEDHFFGLREAKPDMVGVALFDRLDKNLQQGMPLLEMMWQRREIENYLCTEETLLAYARHDVPNDLFGVAELAKREQAMREAIQEISSALRTLGKPEPWSPDIKVSDDFLEPLFSAFFKKLGLPLLLRKSEYYQLAPLMPKDQIAAEVREKLDMIVGVAKKAKPRIE